MTQTSEDTGKHSKATTEGGILASRKMFLWSTVLLVYLLLLIAIGYIAFWDQDFNEPKNTIAPYVQIMESFKQHSVESKGQELTEKEFAMVLMEVMRKNADNAGDLQELASQSFNIVLGAILAFLSASATMVFQRSGGAKDKEE